MTPVRLESAAPRSRVKHSTTEPLRSLSRVCDRTKEAGEALKFEVKGPSSNGRSMFNIPSIRAIEPVSSIMYKLTCAHSEYSNHFVYPHSLIRVLSAT